MGACKVKQSKESVASSSTAFAYPYGKDKTKCNNSIAQMANNCLSLTHTLVEDEEMKLKVFKNGVQIN